MNDKRTGLVAAVAVILAVLGISGLPRKTSEGAASVDTRKGVSQPEGQEPKAQESSACDEIRKRLKRFFPEEAFPFPDSCYDPSRSSSSALHPHTSADIRFLIAIAPNPVTTHLALLFDRGMETIQQAAQDENYSYDSSWFPWENAPKQYALLKDQLQADELQAADGKQPGILVFRSSPKAKDRPGGPPATPPYDGGLVVFVVAEQPTSGIADQQFRDAIEWVKLLSPQPEQTLRILGPTFSGSLPSLALQLKDLIKPPDFAQVEISSGSVSSDASYNWFRQWLADRNLGIFRTFLEGDQVMTDRFVYYLEREGYHRNQVAILSEDETAFGSSRNKSDEAGTPGSDHAAQGPLYLFYPRDIASLRSAYEEQSIFSSGQQSANPNAPTTTLRNDLSEPASGEHDTMRSYGGQLTPLAQESVLLAIVNFLKENNIQFVIVRSSNSLDQIFLSEFLRKAFPQGRVVLDGADLLFRRGSAVSLRGVMTLATYPLLAEEQSWVPPLLHRSRAYRVFSEDLVEGEYIAARNLLRSIAPPGDAGQVPIRDYAAPAWARSADDSAEDKHAATWVSVVSSRQFWPVAVLNASTLPESGEKSILEPLPNRGGGADKIQKLSPDLIALLVACLAWAGLHFYCCYWGSIKEKPRMRVYFAPLAGNSHKLMILAGSLLLTSLAVVLAAGCGLFSAYLRTGLRLSLAAATVVVFAAGWLACVGNFRLPVLHGLPILQSDTKRWSIKEWRWFGGIVPLVVTAVLAGLYYFVLGAQLIPANSFPAYWRSIHVLSGVSPLLPQVLLIAGLYAWFWFSLQGLALAGDDRPRLPSRSDLPPLLNLFSREDAGDTIESTTRSLTKSYLKKFSFFFAVVLAVWALALHGFSVRCLGERRYGAMIFFGLSLCMALVLANSWQLLHAWCSLRPLLVRLDRLPLRRTLQSLKGLAWGSVWKMGGNVLEERYKVLSRQLESLGHLRNSIAGTRELEASKRTAILARLDDCRAEAHRFAQWYVGRMSGDEYLSDLGPMQAYQEKLAATAGYVMEAVLFPAWQKETESLIFERTADKADEGTAPVASVNLPRHVQAAEEFFVLPYLGFIQNTLGRIRPMVFSGLCVFVAATLCVSSYPFDPRPVLAGGFLLVFLLAGAAMIFAYAEMYRDATLSHIANTRPGELGGGFWFRIFTFGIGPLLGLMTTLFPSITDFVVSWLQPSLQVTR